MNISNTRTSKYKIAEQILRILAGGDISKDENIDIREIILAVGQSFASIAERRFFENRSVDTRRIDGQLIFSFDDVEVKEDKGKNLFYSELPSSIVSLPNGMGISAVTSSTDISDAFVPTTNNYLSLFRSSPIFNLGGRRGYFQENGRIYYVNIDPLNCPDKVIIKMVASLDGIGDEDEIIVPKNIENEIVREVLQLFGNPLPHDTVNDDRDLNDV